MDVKKTEDKHHVRIWFVKAAAAPVERRLQGDQAVSALVPSAAPASPVIRAQRRPPDRQLVMTGASAAPTASTLRLSLPLFVSPNLLLQRCCLQHSPGFGSEFIWTPGLFAQASSALIKLDPLPDGGWRLQPKSPSTSRS